MTLVVYNQELDNIVYAFKHDMISFSVAIELLRDLNRRRDGK